MVKRVVFILFLPVAMLYLLGQFTVQAHAVRLPVVGSQEVLQVIEYSGYSIEHYPDGSMAENRDLEPKRTPANAEGLGNLPCKFYQFLLQFAGNDPRYRHFFALLILVALITLLKLPLTWQSIKWAIAYKQLAPYIREIQEKYAGDRSRIQQELVNLYSSRGLLTWGCLGRYVQTFFIDIVFMIWMYFCLSCYSPQLSSEGASFLWIRDLAAPDTLLLLIWIVTGIVASNLQSRQTPAYTRAVLSVSYVLFGILAWFLQWSAIFILFLAVLTAVGWLLNVICQKIIIVSKP